MVANFCFVAKNWSRNPRFHIFGRKKGKVTRSYHLKKEQPVSQKMKFWTKKEKSSYLLWIWMPHFLKKKRAHFRWCFCYFFCTLFSPFFFLALLSNSPSRYNFLWKCKFARILFCYSQKNGRIFLNARKILLAN